MRTPENSRSAWLLPLMTLGLIAGVMLGRMMECRIPSVAGLLAALAAALLLPGRRRMLALMLLSASLGALLTVCASHPALPEEGEYVVTGVVLDEIQLEESGRIRSVLSDVTLNGKPLGGDAWWSAYLNEDEFPPSWLQPGVRIAFIGRAYHPQGRSNPDGYDFRASLLQSGIILGLYGRDGLQPAADPAGLRALPAAWRHDLTQGLIRVMGQESGALAAAMLLGTRDYLLPEDENAFRDLGLAHILSVSGYHVGVLALLLSRLSVPLSLRRGLRVTLLGVILTLYALLTGANAPVIRAGLLLMLRELSLLRHRRAPGLHLLCLSAFIQLLYNPLQLFSASFQLTYGAMLGLILIHPRLQRVLQPMERRGKGFAAALSATLAVQLGLLPAQLYWFQGFPLVSLLLNPLVLALTSGVMLLYWLTLALLPVPVLSGIVGAATGWLTGLMLAGLRALAGVVGGNLWVPAANLLTLLGWVMLCIGLSVLLHARKKWLQRSLSLAGACLIALSLMRLPHTGTYWLQFSCGEADAALLHDRDAVILVDAGDDVHTVADYLKRRRLSVDALILTHLHEDHAGGLEGLIDARIPVDVCYLPRDAWLAGDLDEVVLEQLDRLAAAGTRFLFISRGDVIETPSSRLTALWPQAGAVRPGQSANNTCLVLRAEILGTTMLLAADLTGRYEMYAAVPADILKAAHHGSDQSTSPEFLDTVSPQVILLSCGEEAREADLAARTGSIPLYSTHSHGALTLHFSQGAFTVEPFLPR